RLIYCPVTTQLTPALDPLSLHDALPISPKMSCSLRSWPGWRAPQRVIALLIAMMTSGVRGVPELWNEMRGSVASLRSLSNSRSRSEEHTSELQSRFELVCRLLLGKKNMC